MTHLTQPQKTAIRVTMLDLVSFVPYYTGHLCAGLQRDDGIQVTLASITYHLDPGFFRRLGLQNAPGLIDVVFRLRQAPPPLRRVLKLMEYLINLVGQLLHLAWSKPDAIHVQFLPLASYGISIERWALHVVRALGIRVIYTVHNVLPQDSQDRHRAIYRRMYRLADRLICHDAEAASRLITEFGVPPEVISIIPHGPLFENERRSDRRQARAKLKLCENDCLVLWQGILRPYKGLSFLLKAWQRVCTHSPRARLAIVGTGDRDLVRAVQDEVKLLGISDQVLLDLRFVSVEELSGLFEAADVLVYPYREITTSGALMTGVVHGKAIVATALPAFEQILRHGESALLVRYGNVEELALALLRLIRHPELRRAMGERLLESQGRISRWEDIAERTIACYRTVISDAPSRKPVFVRA
jgi:glycosyltransferase involved in cell wall biosynthesis